MVNPGTIKQRYRISILSEQAIVFTLFYLFFLWTLAENFSSSHDSISYLNAIILDYPVFHQHHLLYHFTAHYWYLILDKIFPGIQNYYLVETYSAVWGAGCLVLVYTFFRIRFALPVSSSAAGTCVVAFSYGMWFYSVNIEAYVMPMFFILLCLYILSKKRFTPADIWKIALVHSLAVLSHQVNILFSIVVLYVLWKNRRNLTLSSAVFKYVFLSAILVGSVYFYVGFIVEHQNTFTKWFHWVQGYTTDKDYWQPPGITTPLNAAIGYSHSIVGGHHFFRLPFLGRMADNLMSNHSLRDEIYLSRNLDSSGAVLLTCLSFVIAILLLVLNFRFAMNYKRMAPEFRSIMSMILLTIMVYSLFFLFWMPEILEFWILQSVLIWIILIASFFHAKPSNNFNPAFIVPAMAILLFIVNYFGSIRYLKSKNHDWYYSAVKKIEPGKNDIILVQDPWILKDYMEYYTKARVSSVPSNNMSVVALNRTIDSVIQNSGTIFIYPEVRRKRENENTGYIDSILTVFAARKTLLVPGDPKVVIIR